MNNKEKYFLTKVADDELREQIQGIDNLLDSIEAGDKDLSPGGDDITDYEILDQENSNRDLPPGEEPADIYDPNHVSSTGPVFGGAENEISLDQSEARDMRQSDLDEKAMEETRRQMDGQKALGLTFDAERHDWRKNPATGEYYLRGQHPDDLQGGGGPAPDEDFWRTGNPLAWMLGLGGLGGLGYAGASVMGGDKKKKDGEEEEEEE